MATVSATKSGNWSDPTVWDTNPTLPQAGDTVKPASYTVAIDQAVAVTALDNTTSGGGFTVAAARTIAANIIGGTAICVVCSHTTGTVAITGNVTGGTAAACYGLSNTAAGAVTVSGTVTGGSNNTAHGIYNSGAGTVTITNNVAGSATAAANGIYNAGAGAFVVNGNVTGSGANSSIGAANASTGTITINGNVTGGGGTSAFGCRNDNATGSITVTGNATGGSGGTAYGAFCWVGTITVGRAIASSGSAGVFGNTGTTMRAAAIEFAANGQTPTVGLFKFIADQPSSEIVVIRSDGAGTQTLKRPRGYFLK